MANKRYNFAPGSKSAENVKRNKENARRISQATAKSVPTDCEAERDRNFCLSTYIPVNELETFLRSRPWVSHWCYTTHHSDIKEDGTPKEIHTHVLLYTHDAKTSSGVKKNFDRFAKEIVKEGEEPQNTLCQICHDMVAQYRYQLHLDDKDKYQYSFNERISDSPTWWSRLEHTDGMTSTENTSLAIINDILNGVSVMQLAERYGKDYVYHIPAFEKFISQYSREQYLREDNSKNISEYFRVLLENSPLPQEQITAFFNCLDYIKQECIFTYNSKLNFYLDEVK